VQPVEDIDTFLIIAVVSGLVLDVPGFTARTSPFSSSTTTADRINCGNCSTRTASPACRSPTPDKARAQTVPTGGVDQQWLATIRGFATGIDAESAWLIQHQAIELALTLTSAAAGANISAQLDNGGVDRTQAWWGGLVWRAGSLPAACTLNRSRPRPVK